MLVAILALAAMAQEPARTVNGQILGPAEEFATSGPARVCLHRTSIDVLEGETAYLDYLGIHWGGVRVTGPLGTLEVREGDAWAEPRTAGRIVSQSADSEIVRHRQRNRSRYLIYGRSEYSDDGTSPVAWVEGDALNGSTRDMRLLRRIDVNQPDMSSCQRRFIYGWGPLLGIPEEE